MRLKVQDRSDEIREGGARLRKVIASFEESSRLALERLSRVQARHRRAIFAFAFAVFTAGLILSLRDLGIGLSDIRWRPAAVLAFVLVPCTIAYSAVNMMLMAHAARVPMRFIDGVRVSVFAQVAEMLPVPGGAIVRTAALNKAGAGLAKSLALILLFSFLWVALATLAAGAALWHLGWLPQSMTGVGLVASFIVLACLGHSFGWIAGLGAVGLRLFGLALVAFRIYCAFAVIGAIVQPAETFLFVFASVIGSAASLVPAGLGVSETLSAFLAGLISFAPAAAFLAPALNRLIGLAMHLLVALAFMLAGRLETVEMRNGTSRAIGLQGDYRP